LIERLCARSTALSTYYHDYPTNGCLLTASAKSYKITVMPACKLTPEVECEILNLVGAGNTLTHSARAAGIVAETASNWVKWGKAGREPYAAFAAKLDMAEAKAITDSVDSIRTAGKTDWRAAKCHLEYLAKRRDSPQNISAQLEEILQVVEDVLGKSEAKKVLRAIIERSGGEEVSDPRAAIRLVSTR
jgi:hypothetical protein